MSRFASTVFLVSCLLIISSVAHALVVNGGLQALFSSDIPTIDGQWTTANEWTDASETRLENTVNMTGYLRVKHNFTCIFILLDFATDYTRSTYDIGGVCFDRLDNGGVLPQSDDYLFGIQAGQTPAQVDVFQGTGTGQYPRDAWARVSLVDVEGKANYSHVNDPYEGSIDHRIYEFQIPCKYLGAAEDYGFYVFACDYHSNSMLEWPLGAGGNWTRMQPLFNVPPSPQNWGAVTDNFIPEFPLNTFALLIVLAFSAVMLIGEEKLRLSLRAHAR
ncbi:MAG: hypothetical protein QHH24_02205 [Candidatus Bathyarchaeota archaeon]|jgi:hypothetical protein|nr:hypothetical protein [Candidatus Bathyarchaeota archaeon]